MTIKLWSFLLALLLMVPSQAQDNRNVTLYNLENSLGLKGFDPVSYFPEGGGQAMEGDAAIALVYSGVRYHFASEEHVALFKMMPERYEPTYGGWCAWAMANGSKIDINPAYFTLDGNRLHLFLSRRAKRNFDRDVERFSASADRNWLSISGEEPRL